MPEPTIAITFDRYAYTRNNSIKYSDPSGHDVGCPASNPVCTDYSYLTGSIDTAAITVTKTRYGDYFLGIGPSVSTAPMSLNINRGNVDPYHDLMVSQEEIKTFLSGWAINVSTGFLEDISVTYSPTAVSQVHDIVEHGMASPLVVGVSF